jgi:hypothetical protein
MADSTAHRTSALRPATQGVNMSKSAQSLKVLAVIIGVCALSACQSLDTTVATPAAKIDSGLGDLPHYRDWIDPSGRMPMTPVTTARDTTR